MPTNVASHLLVLPVRGTPRQESHETEGAQHSSGRSDENQNTRPFHVWPFVCGLYSIALISVPQSSAQAAAGVMKSHPAPTPNVAGGAWSGRQPEP